MDEEKDNVIHLQSWKKKDKRIEEEIPQEEDAYEEESIPALDLGARLAGNVFLTAAYAKGYSDGRAQKWREIKPLVVILIISNLASLINHIFF